MKISAILPNYNSVEFLPKSIQSLLQQTEPFSEILIIDDGSTDESIAVIESYMNEHKNIRLIKHEHNQGVCSALNTGLKHAIGDYVILCAADDWYHQKSVARAKQIIENHPTVGIICGDAVVHRFDQTSSFERTLPYPKNTLVTAEEFKILSKRKYVGFNGGGGMFMNKQAIISAGLLYPELRWHCDWLLYFVVAFRQGLYYVNETFVYINMRNDGYSEGKRDWKIQKQVMVATINVLQKNYPELWNNFKEAALSPYYAIKCIPLFLMNSGLRRFVTWRLLWKFIINNPMVVRIGRLFPYPIILGMRKFLRA